MAAHPSKRTGSKSQDSHYTSHVCSGQYLMGANTPADQLNEDDSRVSEAGNPNDQTMNPTPMTRTVKTSPHEPQPRRFEPRTQKALSQSRDVTESSFDKSEACACSCTSNQPHGLDVCADRAVSSAWSANDEAVEALARQESRHSVQPMAMKAPKSFEISGDVINAKTDGPLARCHFGDALTGNTSTTEVVDQTCRLACCFHLQFPRENEPKNGPGPGAFLVSEHGGDVSNKRGQDQPLESNGCYQHEQNLSAFQARHHDTHTQEPFPLAVSMTRANENQVPCHCHCPLDATHWSRQQRNQDGASSFSMRESSLQQDGRAANRVDREDRQPRMGNRKSLSDPNEAGGEKDRTSVTFDDVITTLDLLLLRTSSQNSLTKVKGGDTFPRPGDTCLGALSNDEMPGENSTSGTTSLILADHHPAMTTETSLAMCPSSALRHTTNAVLAGLRHLSVSQQVSYFNNRIQACLSDGASEGCEDAGVLHQLLIALTFCLLDHSHSNSHSHSHSQAVAGPSLLKPALYHLYQLDVVGTLVSAVACQSNESWQTLSVVCWLLTFLIMEQTATEGQGEPDQVPDGYSPSTYSPDLVGKRDGFSQQFLASQGANAILRHLSKGSIAGPSFMGVSTSLVLPITALVVTPLGRTWLENNCQEHISEFKGLLIQRKPFLDELPHVFPLLAREAVDRLVGEFVDFAEGLEARDRERNLAELLEEEERERMTREQRKKKKRQKKQARSRKGGNSCSGNACGGGDISSEDEQPPVTSQTRNAKEIREPENGPAPFVVCQGTADPQNGIPPPKNWDTIPTSRLPQIVSKIPAAGSLKEDREWRVVALPRNDNQDPCPTEDFPPISRSNTKKAAAVDASARGGATTFEGKRNAERDHITHSSRYANNAKCPANSGNAGKPLRWADVARIGCSATDRKSHLTVLSNESDPCPKGSVPGKGGKGVATSRENATLQMGHSSDPLVGEPIFVTPSSDNHVNDVDLTQSSDNDSDDDTQSSSSEFFPFLFPQSLYPRANGQSAFGTGRSTVTPKESYSEALHARKTKVDPSLLAWPSLTCQRKREGGGSESMPCLWEEPKGDSRAAFLSDAQVVPLRQKRCPSFEVIENGKDSIRLPQVSGNALHRTRSMDMMDSENCSKRKYHKALTQPDSSEAFSRGSPNLKRLLLSDFTSDGVQQGLAESFFTMPSSKIEPFTNLPPLKARRESPDRTLDEATFQQDNPGSNGAGTCSRDAQDAQGKTKFRLRPYSVASSCSYKHSGYKSFMFFPTACNIPKTTTFEQMVLPMNGSSRAAPPWPSGQEGHAQDPTPMKWQAENDISLLDAMHNVDPEMKALISEPRSMVVSVSHDMKLPLKMTNPGVATESFQVPETKAQVWNSASKFSAYNQMPETTANSEPAQQQQKDELQSDVMAPQTYLLRSSANASTQNMAYISNANNAPSFTTTAFGQEAQQMPDQDGETLSSARGPASPRHVSLPQKTTATGPQTNSQPTTNQCYSFPCCGQTKMADGNGAPNAFQDAGSPDAPQPKHEHRPGSDITQSMAWNPPLEAFRTNPLETPITPAGGSGAYQGQDGGKAMTRTQMGGVEDGGSASPPGLFPDDVRDKSPFPSPTHGAFPAFHESRTGDFLNELFTDPFYMDKVAVNQLRQQIRASWTNAPPPDTTLGSLRESSFLDDLDYYASLYCVQVKDVLGLGADTDVIHNSNQVPSTGLQTSSHVPNTSVPTAADMNLKATRSRRWRDGLDSILELAWTRRQQYGDVILPVSGSEFKICHCSQGPFYLGYTTEGRESAILVLNKRHFRLDPYRLDVLSDPELDHHFLLRCQGSGDSYRYQYVAFQLCEYSLTEYLQLLSLSSNQDANIVLGLAWQLLEGLNFVHLFFGSPHGNIKPSWIFIDAEGHLRLGGFGFEPVNGHDDVTIQGYDLSCLVTPEEETPDLPGHPSFTADIQMAGVLIYHILTRGQRPFNGLTLDREVGLTRENLFLSDLHLGEEALDLLSGMIFQEPELRPNADQCLKHPFFWTAERKFRLILIVGSDVLTEMKTGVALTGCGAPTMMEILGLVDINEVCPNWVQEVNMTVMKEMRSFRVYKNNLSELALFIYNCCLHFDKLSNVAKDVLDEPYKYFQTLFPSLFMAIYRSLKSSDRVQRTCYKPFF